MPFDEFPFELIQRIFILCCGGVRIKEPRLNRSQSGSTQVTLSLVCSRWREVVLNTSALWADVLVAVNYDAEEQETTAPLQMVQNWLNRARRTPISLIITIFAAREPQIAAISQTLLSAFNVKSLDLQSIDCPLLIPPNNSHCLEGLHLLLYGPARNDVFPRLPEMPSLKELQLSLRLSDFMNLTNLYLIPWHRLHVFTISLKPWPSRMLFDILQRCKSLVECTLFVMPEHDQNLGHDIILPNLESLVLDMSLEGSADAIIQSLTLPNLKLVDIRSWKQHCFIPLSLEAIENMAQRSGFRHLTHFSLSRTLRPVDVSSLLESMSALKSVELHGPLTFQPGTFDDLSFGRIGPQLEEIYFGVMSDEEIELLLATVGQRHDQAKRVPDIRPFVAVTCHCTNRSNFEFHNQQAKRCSKTFNAHVAIIKSTLTLQAVDSDGSLDSDLSTELASDEEPYLNEESG